jgi:hypothetical protein
MLWVSKKLDGFVSILQPSERVNISIPVDDQMLSMRCLKVKLSLKQETNERGDGQHDVRCKAKDFGDHMSGTCAFLLLELVHSSQSLCDRISCCAYT